MVDEVDLYFHENQRLILDNDARNKIIACGRRFGKTEYCAREHILKAFSGDPDGVQWMIAPTYPLSKIMWRKLHKIIKKSIPKKYVTDIMKGELYVELRNGTTIWCKSGDKPESLVGEGLNHVSLDEFGTMDADVWQESVRPTLLDTGGTASFIGTPKGKNEFYDLFKRGTSELPEDKAFQSFQFSSFDNPLIDRFELTEIVKDMPTLKYRQEILAEFIEDGGEVFTNYTHRLRTPTPCNGTDRYTIFGLDLAKKQDFTVMVGYDFNSGKNVYYRRLNQTSWDSQERLIKGVSELFPNHTIFMDATGVGDPIFENVLGLGVNAKGCIFTAGKEVSRKGTTISVPKNHLVESMALDIEVGSFVIPDFKEVRHEFDVYKYVLSPTTRRFVYNAPKGHNDDTVIACALAHFGLKSSASAIGIVIGEDEDLDEDSKIKSNRNNYDEDDEREDYDDIEDVADWSDYN